MIYIRKIYQFSISRNGKTVYICLNLKILNFLLKNNINCLRINFIDFDDRVYLKIQSSKKTNIEK